MVQYLGIKGEEAQNMDLTVKLQVFEGPLDLLLHLIDKNKVNIYDIPISLITEQYLEYLEEMMRQEALACKKCTQYSQMFTDTQLKNMCDQLSCHHKQRFDTLYSFLESNK